MAGWHRPSALPVRTEAPSCDPAIHVHHRRTQEYRAQGRLPRLKILEVFQNSSQRHMTAEDVFRVLLEGCSDIGWPPCTAC